MSDNLIELLKIAADMPLSRIQDDEECADSLTRLCGRAAEALASLQQRNLLFMREREGAREDANTYQRLAARLAPVEDEALVEIVAKVLQRGSQLEWSVLPEEWKKDWRRDARFAIAAIRPHIEAAEREWCAKAGKAALLKSNYGELHADANYADELGEEIAAAIRSGKS